VSVVADVDADLAVGGIENRPVRLARFEVKLLPETGDLGDMGLVVLAEVAAVGIEDCGGVVVNTGHRLFVDRYDDDHAMLGGQLLHHLAGRAFGDALGGVVPLLVLAGAEVGLVERPVRRPVRSAAGALRSWRRESPPGLGRCRSSGPSG